MSRRLPLGAKACASMQTSRHSLASRIETISSSRDLSLAMLAFVRSLSRRLRCRLGANPCAFACKRRASSRALNLPPAACNAQFSAAPATRKGFASSLRSPLRLRGPRACLCLPGVGSSGALALCASLVPFLWRLLCGLPCLIGCFGFVRAGFLCRCCACVFSFCAGFARFGSACPVSFVPGCARCSPG